MKKTLQLLLLGAALVGSPSAVYAQKVSTSNITSLSATAKAAAVDVTLTGSLSTSGNGDFRQLRDLCYQMQTLNLKSATCPNIPKNALHSRHRLHTLTLPNSLKTIGSQAFFACDSLSGTLSIPKTTTSIGASAFAQCKSIEAVDIPAASSLQNIGSYAFEGCESLSGKVTIPSKLVVLRDGVFSGCRNLEGVNLPSTLQSIGANTFSGCTKLTGEVELGRMVTRIGASAFAGCESLTHISLPRALQQLGDAAFAGCTSLGGSLTLPESVQQIGQGAFCGCSSVESFTLPSTLTSVPAATFAGCTGLTALYVFAATPPVADATAFAGVDCKNVSLYVPEGSEAAYKEADVWKEFKIETIVAGIHTAETSAYTWSVADGVLTVKNLPASSAVALYQVNGQLLESAEATGEVHFTLPQQGVYLLKVNGKSQKVKY